MDTVLITGASGGIGFELAKLFAKDKYTLVLVAKDKNKLEKAAKEIHSKSNCNIRTIDADLALYGAADMIVNLLKRDKLNISILVNNAGFGTYGEFASSNLEDELSEIQVNIIALTSLTRLLLEPMVKAGRGKILNVASTAAFLPGPLMSVYYATKAYVLSFTEALSEELKGTGVTITALCPGPTETGFSKRANIVSNSIFSSNRKLMNAKVVAFAGYNGLMNGKRIVIPGLVNIITTTFIKFVPKFLVLRVVKNLQTSHANV